MGFPAVCSGLRMATDLTFIPPPACLRHPIATLVGQPVFLLAAARLAGGALGSHLNYQVFSFGFVRPAA